MRWKPRCHCYLLFWRSPLKRASAHHWFPVTDAEKNMKTNPLDPGSGAVVLLKRGQINVLERESSIGVPASILTRGLRC